MSATKERVASVRTRRKIARVTPNYPKAERKKSGRKRRMQISQSQSCASNCRKCGDGKRGSIFQTDDVPLATQWTAIRTNRLLVIAVSCGGPSPSHRGTREDSFWSRHETLDRKCRRNTDGELSGRRERAGRLQCGARRTGTHRLLHRSWSRLSWTIGCCRWQCARAV